MAETLNYVIKKPCPLLQDNLVSDQLRIADLGRLIGADSNASKAKRGVAQIAPNSRILPVVQFDTKRWDSIDVDINFIDRKIIRSKELPIQNLKAEIYLNNRQLSLIPLTFGIAGGIWSIPSSLIDGSPKTIKAEISLSARHLKTKQLFTTLESTHTSLGEINRQALIGVGNSVGALLANSNGELKTLANKGAISKCILDAAGLNIGNVAPTKLFGDKQGELNCLAGDFAITNGIMQVKTFLLDIDDAIITVSGEINLANEILTLNIMPKSKGPRLMSLRSPLYISGTFKNPNVGVWIRQR